MIKIQLVQFLAPIVLLILGCLYLSISFAKSPSENSRKNGTLCIAACQFPVSSDIFDNAEWIEAQLREAKKLGADLVHFSECALSGYAGADFDSVQMIDWRLLREKTGAILRLAEELRLWVVLGSTHQLNELHKPHNCLYVINPEGKIVDRYDKRFCTEGDLKHYSPGDHFVIFRINGVTCGLLICYDVRFPEMYREYVKRGTHIIFHSFYNARQKDKSVHPIIMPATCQARAASNHFFVSVTNSCAPLSWPCHFITPDGLIARKLEFDKPGILISEIDINQDFYDAARPYRMDAIRGKLNSGNRIEDPRSSDRSCY